MTDGIRGAMVSAYEKALKYSGYDAPVPVLRRRLFGWLFTPDEKQIDEVHTSSLTDGQVMALWDFVGSWKDDDGEWHVRDGFLAEVNWAMTHAFYYFTVDGVERARGNNLSIAMLLRKNPMGDEGMDSIDIPRGGTVKHCIEMIGAIHYQETHGDADKYYQDQLIPEELPVREHVKINVQQSRSICVDEDMLF
jgi:hypothetical protein